MQEKEPESESEAEVQPEGELRIEAEQMTGVKDAAASPKAAAKFEEPPSESEVHIRCLSSLLKCACNRKTASAASSTCEKSWTCCLCMVKHLVHVDARSSRPACQSVSRLIPGVWWQVSEGKLDISAGGQTVEQAAASPQPQAMFKTGEAAEQVKLPSILAAHKQST